MVLLTNPGKQLSYCLILDKQPLPPPPTQTYPQCIQGKAITDQWQCLTEDDIVYSLIYFN